LPKKFHSQKISTSDELIVADSGKASDKDHSLIWTAGVADSIQRYLQYTRICSDWKVKMNYPFRKRYRGIDDPLQYHIRITMLREKNIKMVNNRLIDFSEMASILPVIVCTYWLPRSIKGISGNNTNFVLLCGITIDEGVFVWVIIDQRYEMAYRNEETVLGRPLTIVAEKIQPKFLPIYS
jgi:hypothetical protein